MKTFSLLGVFAVSTALFLVGCGPGGGRGGYYGSSYDPFYRSGYYSDNSYDPYYRGGYYDGRSYGGRYNSHAEKHDQLEHKYNKAMNRLDRQEREAEAKAYRKYDGNIQDPRYQETQRRIDQKYDHKRGKVERNLKKDHRKYHDRAYW